MDLFSRKQQMNPMDLTAVDDTYVSEASRRLQRGNKAMKRGNALLGALLSRRLPSLMVAGDVAVSFSSSPSLLQNVPLLGNSQLSLVQSVNRFGTYSPSQITRTVTPGGGLLPIVFSPEITADGNTTGTIPQDQISRTGVRWWACVIGFSISQLDTATEARIRIAADVDEEYGLFTPDTDVPYINVNMTARDRLVMDFTVQVPAKASYALMCVFPHRVGANGEAYFTPGKIGLTNGIVENPDPLAPLVTAPVQQACTITFPSGQFNETNPPSVSAWLATSSVHPTSQRVMRMLRSWQQAALAGNEMGFPE